MANNERVVGGIKTRLLHNKDYVEVTERVRIAHAVEDDFEQIEDGVVEVAGRLLWRSVIRVKGKIYIGHAEVKLDAPKNTPDGTNPFECAETSAIGRALAFAGLGTVESIASYDEIARALPVVSVEPAHQQRVVESKQQQIAAPTVPTIEKIRTLADQVYASEGGYADFRSMFVGKYELGDIPDDDIPERIRAEMAELIRADVAERRKAKQPAEGAA